MNFLLLSKDNKLLDLILDTNGWHHTMHKFVLLKNDIYLNRNKYKEVIKGVLFTSGNFDYYFGTNENIKTSKTVCYPPISKLNLIMNKFCLLKYIFKNLKNEECINYDWMIYDNIKCELLSSFEPKFSYNKVILSLNKNKELLLLKDHNDEVIINEIIDTNHHYGLFIREHWDSKKHNFIFIGNNTFYFVNNKIQNIDKDDELLILAKKIKKIAKLTQLELEFAEKESKKYLVKVEPFPEISNEIKDVYEKYIISKMKYIENKVNKLESKK